jgi:hypothetical protein
MPSGHKAFLVNNSRDVDLLLMHNGTFAAEYVPPRAPHKMRKLISYYRIAHAVSARKRIDIISRAKQLGVKVTNAKAKVTTES